MLYELGIVADVAVSRFHCPLERLLDKLEAVPQHKRPPVQDCRSARLEY